ncbi:response regulator transcription factor [Pseudidiomarina sp.]|uniref:response regulator transcription factor n=1 Tax=Pseudidiomarina sp. TaxID=2081707 RepID=UPI003A980ED8
MYKILLADAYPICRLGLATLIESVTDLSVCGEADSAHEAQHLVQKLRPDALVLGLQLAQGSGLQLIHSLRAQHQKLPILVVSMYDEILFAERVIRAGANGYMHKSETGANLLVGLRQILKGKLYLSASMSDRLLRSHLHGHVSDPLPSESKLTDREMEVYMLLGQGYTTKRIANELHLSPKTVDSHKEHIKEKLGITDNIMLLRRALTWSIEK